MTLPTLGLQADGSPAAADVDLEIVELLGEGGMGAVWLARQRSLRREVALKRPSTRAPGEVASRAIVDEARTSGALEHPNIVPVHVLGVDVAGEPILVMKRVEGTTLEALIREPEQPAWTELEARYGDRTGAVLEILSRVADALQFAHERGVVHRDVKPENVMVGRYGEVYLLDWGIALDVRHPSDVGTLVGTPAYLAPEMLSGDIGAIDPRTDVFLLGATLHAALTGKPLHEGDDVLRVLERAQRAEPRLYGPEVPIELAELCRRATAFDPADRPATALALRAELAEQLRHRGSLALAREIETRLAAIAPASTDAAGEALAATGPYRVLLESRFALAHALADFPKNAVARRALRKALAWIAEAELHRGSADAAEEAAREMDPPDAALLERVERLHRERREARRLEEIGRAEEYERDPRHAARALGALVVACASGMIALIVRVLTRNEADPMTMRDVALFDAFIVGTALAGAVAFRRRLYVNRHGRALTSTIIVVICGGAAADAVSAVQGRPVEQAVPMTLLCVAVAIAAAAPSLGWRLLWGTAVMVVACALALASPAAAPVLVSVAVLVAVVLAALELRRQTKAGQKSSGEVSSG